MPLGGRGAMTRAAQPRQGGRRERIQRLRVLQDLDGATTAKAMGCSEGAVKTHLSRARQALQQSLEIAL